MTCDNCGDDFDPIRTRWRCTTCGMKHPCCDGEPQPLVINTLDKHN